MRSKVHGDGTVYHHGQIARVTMVDGRVTEGEIYLTTERVDLPAFVGTMSNGKPLQRPITAQSRWVSHPRHAGWAS